MLKLKILLSLRGTDVVSKCQRYQPITLRGCYTEKVI